MIVDAHLHIWHALPSYPEPSITTVSPVSEIPIELFHEYMAEHGVDRGVLVQPLFPGEDNRYVSGCVRQEPDRFAAVCYVNPLSADAKAVLDHWVVEEHCTGVRLRPPSPYVHEELYEQAAQALCRRAAELKVAVSVMASPEHLGMIASIAERFPELILVVDHMAQLDAAAGARSEPFRTLLALARFPRVVIKVSGFYYCSHQPYPYPDCADLFRAVYDAFGPARMMWGSDFPHVLLKSGYRRALLLLDRHFRFLSAQDVLQIMGSTALSVYWH
jgi:predicted TIM-barrel fold metal-dependent hydrolase